MYLRATVKIYCGLNGKELEKYANIYVNIDQFTEAAIHM